MFRTHTSVPPAGQEYATQRFNVITPQKTLSMVLQSNEHTTWVSEYFIKEKSDIEIIARYATAPEMRCGRGEQCRRTGVVPGADQGTCLYIRRFWPTWLLAGFGLPLRDAALQAEEGTFRELFSPGLRKVLLIGVLLALFAHLTGIDTVIYYGPLILMKAGYQSNASAIFGSMLIGLVNLAFTFVGIALVDRIGRKALLLVGLTGMGISMLFTGLLYSSVTSLSSPCLVSSPVSR